MAHVPETDNRIGPRNSPLNSIDPLPDSPSQFAKWLIASRWWLLLLALVLGAAAFVVQQRISFDNSIEGMFAADNETLVKYQRLKETFGGAEIVLAVYEDSDLFSVDGRGLKTLTERSLQLSKVQGVIGVLSLAEINQALNKAYALPRMLSGNPDDKERLQPILDRQDEMAMSFLKTFEGYTHAGDGRTAAIVCLLERQETLNIPRDQTIDTLRTIAGDWPDSRITGEPVLIADGFSFIRRDGKRLNQICLSLMAIVIVVCFRSLRWVIIPIVVLQLSLWMTLAVLVLFGWQLTMVSSMLSAIVAVISVATIVHITVRYRESRLKVGLSRPEAMHRTLSTLLMPIMWTCLTTAAGFFALTLAQVEPISDFGWMMTLGSLFVLLNVLLVVPGLALLGNMDSDPQGTWGEGWLEKILKFSSEVISRHPKSIGLIVFVVMAVIGSGMNYLKIETDFTKNFSEDTEIIKAYTFVEERMGGAGALDVVLKAPKRLSSEFLERVDSLQRDLRELCLDSSNGNQKALTHVVSFADADRILRSNELIARLKPEIRFAAMAGVMPGFAGQMRTTKADENGNHFFRIMLRTSQQKSAEEQAELIEKVESTVAQHFPPASNGDSADSDSPSSMTTGFFVLLSNLVSSVLDDQLKTFLAACFFIGIVVLIAFGSLRLVLVALIPNIIPIIGLLGMLGWLDIKMNMGAAMIAAVSMGLSIDGTIHYLTAYRRRKKEGLTTAEAIGRVQFRTGRALIYATIALVIGFGSLCVSEFVPTVFFGGLVGLSMLGGMFGNLIVLPILLTLIDGKPQKTATAAA